MKTDQAIHPSILNPLRANPLFEDITNDQLSGILKYSKIDTWEKKTCILDTDTTMYRFYILMSGRIKAYSFDIVSGRQVTIYLLHKNDFFDVCTLIKGCTHQIYYEALDDTKVLSIPILRMREWVSSRPDIMKRLFSYTITKMQKLEDNVSDLSLDDVEKRVAKLLIKNLDPKTQQIPKLNGLSHKELAKMIGTSRAIFNRHLQNFKKEGIIEIKRKDIHIINGELLIDKILS